MNKRCPDKVSHPSIVAALQQLISAPRHLGLRRIYKCAFCLGWHTTSQERREIRDAVERAHVRKILHLTR
jgi:hypothetical protein